MTYYNLSIDIRQRRCVVVGGGRVALRKVRKLCAAEADVIVVSPDVLPEFHNENCTIIYEKYHAGVLADAVLVFAATSSAVVNAQICKDAEKLGIWANSVNGVHFGSFIIPASCRKNILTLGITTEGKAPALSKELRKYLQEKLEKVDNELLEEIVSLREEKVAEVDTTKKEDLEQIIRQKALAVIKQMDEK